MNKEMKMLTNGLITQKYTKVMKETEYQYNAPHLYTVINKENEDELCKIHFQEGPIKDCGVNGVATEDLIAMCIDRLQHFQNSKFNCRENEMAITKLEESLMWLRKRTLDREAKGIEGTNVVDSVEDTLSQNPLYKELNTYQKEQLDNFIKENSITREQVLLQKNISGPVYLIQVVNINDMERKSTLYRYRLDDVISEKPTIEEDALSENPLYRELTESQKQQLDNFIKENSFNRKDVKLYVSYEEPVGRVICVSVNKKSYRNMTFYTDIIEESDSENESSTRENVAFQTLNIYQLEQLEQFIKTNALDKEEISIYEENGNIIAMSTKSSRKIILYKESNRNDIIESSKKPRCEYCKDCVAIVDDGRLGLAICYSDHSKNNAYIRGYDKQGWDISAPFKMNYCPICGDKIEE